MKKKFGIIGNPIKHSLSPVLHGYWFKKYNIDADYEVIEANDKKLPEISRFDPMSISIGLKPGELCEITRPSKTSITTNYYRKCSQ